MSTMLRLGAVGSELRRTAVLPVAVFAGPASSLLGDPSARRLTARGVGSPWLDRKNRYRKKRAKAVGNDAAVVFPPAGNHSWTHRGLPWRPNESDLIASLDGRVGDQERHELERDITPACG